MGTEDSSISSVVRAPVTIGANGNNVFRGIDSVISEAQNVVDFKKAIAMVIQKWRGSKACFALPACAQECVLSHRATTLPILRKRY